MKKLNKYYSLFVYFCRTLTKNFSKSTKPIDTRFSGQPNINKNPPKIYFLSLSGDWLINYYISLVIINKSFIMFTVTICQHNIVLIPKALPVLLGGGKSDLGYKRKVFFFSAPLVITIEYCKIFFKWQHCKPGVIFFWCSVKTNL